MYNNLTDCFDEIGSNFRGHVLVIECNKRETGAGKPFVSMRVTDGTKQIDTVRWNSETEYPVGQVILLTGASGEYNGQEQLTVKGAQYAPEVDRTQFAITLSTKSYDECLMFIDKIQCTRLRVPIRATFEENKDRLLLAAGAVKMHHNYAGGYLDHIHEVTRYAYVIALDSKSDIYNKIDLDVLIASALMHDFGKLVAYRVDEVTGVVQPDANYYSTDHIIDTCAFLRELLEGYEHYDQIEHCVISHHGNLEWGALKQPSSIEAYILHTADMLSSQLESMLSAFDKQANEFGWTTGKVFPFNRYIFIGNK